MISLKGIPFIRTCFFFILGIITSSYFSPPIWIPLSGVGIAIPAFYFFRKKVLFAKNAMMLLFWLSLGQTTLLLHQPTYNDTHYMQYKKVDKIRGYVSSDLKKKSSSHQAFLTVNAIHNPSGWQPANGKILIYIDQNFPLTYGSEIITQQRPKSIRGPSNPNQFDYKHYLWSKHVFSQLYLYEVNTIKTGASYQNPLLSLSYKSRNAIDQILAANFSQSTYSLLCALLIGKKDYLTPHTQHDFAVSGASHVLAVSGLHVGILLSLFAFIFKPIKKHSLFIYTTLVLLSIWSYAFIAGLSPSIIRSTVMFSIMSIGHLYGKRTNLINSLAISAFVMLMYDPLLVMDVGFQLSYMAVLGIILILPLIESKIQIRQKVLQKLWQWTAISISAQIATFPLTILYFHQFPVYFLVSNLVVIPITFCLVCGGLAFVSLFWIPGVNSVIAFLVTMLADTIVFITHAVSSFPFSTFDQLDISVVECLLIYTMIISASIYFYHRTKLMIIIAFLCLIIISVSNIFEIADQSNQAKLVVYDIKRESAIDLINGNNNILICSDKLQNDQDQLEFFIHHHWWSNGISEHQFQRPKPNQLIHWHQKTILYINKKNYSLPETRIDYTIISHNSCNPTDLKKLLKFCKKVIFDTSNSSFYVKKIQKHLQDRDTHKCFFVTEQGAYCEHF